MEVLCKMDLKSEMENLTKGKYYTVMSDFDDCYWIIVDGSVEKDIPYFAMKFNKEHIRRVPFTGVRFSDFFYTIEEMRKFKLRKLNEKSSLFV